MGNNNTIALKEQKAALIQQAQGILANGALTDEQRTQVKDLTTRAEAINETLELNERTAKLAASGIEVRENILDKPFASLGEQLICIRNAATNPHNVDPRLLDLNTRGAAAGASIGVPADGGFLVQPQFVQEVLTRANQTGIVYTRGRKLPLSPNTNSIKIPGIDETSRANGSRWGGVRMFWEGEADALTASRPKFRLIELSTKKLTGLFYATDELVADATAMGSLVNQAFGEEVGYAMDDVALNGDGVGKPLGILQSAALVTVAKEVSQMANTFNFANATKMYSRLHPRHRANSAWFINVDVEPQLWSMTVSNSSVVQGVGPAGVGVYTPPGASGNPFATLLGRPVIPVEQCSTLGTVGDVVLADMSQWIYIDKGMDAASSMHVRFLTDEMAYRWIYRTDGQPIWHRPLTPAKGANTLSPFVTLETRA